jgi:hypothetical protein
MPRGQYTRKPVAQATSKPAEATPAPQALSAHAEETRRERRRRDDGDLDRMGRMALSIPPEVKARLDREGKTYRWVRDAAGRQQAMQNDDWDVTPNVDPVPEARDSEGKLVLMEKFRDWYDDDQRAKTNMLDQREEAIERGAKVDPEDRRQPGTSYVPEGNRISRERGL